MKDKLLKLLNNSYSPYSKFRVSSIVVLKDGKCYSGVNIENSSYGATVCAERVAIFKAVSEGYRKGDFKKIYVMCDSPKISSSCFMCRQVITEFFLPDNEIIFMNNLGEEEKYLVKDICPYPFDDNDLKEARRWRAVLYL